MPTVLVVDDESDIRELLVDTLLDSGFQVIEAPNGVEALSNTHKRKYLQSMQKVCGSRSAKYRAGKRCT